MKVISVSLEFRIGGFHNSENQITAILPSLLMPFSFEGQQISIYKSSFDIYIVGLFFQLSGPAIFI